MNILVLSSRFPWPPFKSDRLRAASANATRAVVETRRDALRRLAAIVHGHEAAA